jgi:hypothetical protein
LFLCHYISIYVDPGHPRALLGIGNVYFYSGEPQRALKWYVRSVERIGERRKKDVVYPRLPSLPLDSEEEDMEWNRAFDAKDAAPEAWKGIAVSLYSLVILFYSILFYFFILSHWPFFMKIK